MKFGLVLALLCLGCGNPDVRESYYDCTAGRARECEAQAFVWDYEFQEWDTAPPSVRWYYAECPYWHDGISNVPDGDYCYAGVYWTDTDLCGVAWRGTFHTSGYAHELMHARQARRGISDSNHQRYQDWQLVDEINRLLSSYGL